MYNSVINAVASNSSQLSTEGTTVRPRSNAVLHMSRT